MVPAIHRGHRNQNRVNKYAAIEPAAIAEDTLQRKGSRERAGNMSARKHARVDPVAAQYPLIEPPYQGVHGGRKLTWKHDPRRLGWPIGELRVAQKQSQEVDQQQLFRGARLSVNVEHAHAEHWQSVNKKVT